MPIQELLEYYEDLVDASRKIRQEGR